MSCLQGTLGSEPLLSFIIDLFDLADSKFKFKHIVKLSI